MRFTRSEAIAPYVTMKIARAIQGSIGRRQSAATTAAASSSPSRYPIGRPAASTT